MRDSPPRAPRLWSHPRIRRGALGLGAAALALLGVWWFAFRPYVTTDDARVAAPVAAIAPAGAGGRVLRVLVKEGEHVRAGDALVLLDDVGQRAQLHRPCLGGGQRGGDASARLLRPGEPVEARLAAGAAMARHAVETASVAAFDDAFLVGALIVMIGIVPALFFGTRAHAARAGNVRPAPATARATAD